MIVISLINNLTNIVDCTDSTIVANIDVEISNLNKLKTEVMAIKIFVI